MDIISRKEAKEKGLPRYYTGKPCKNGHVNERYTANGICRDCSKLFDMKNPDYQKDYYIKNREKKQEYHLWYNENYNHKRKEYREKNKDHIRDYNREYYQRNQEACIKKTEDWRRRNPGYSKKLYAENESYKAKTICANMLRRTLLATNQQKNNRTAKILGYTHQDLVDDITSKLLDGMSWDNYGDVWHIDHLYPVSRYIKDGVKNPSIINALNNLAPMFSEHNYSKDARTLEEYLEEFPDLNPLYGKFIGGEDHGRL